MPKTPKPSAVHELTATKYENVLLKLQAAQVQFQQLQQAGRALEREKASLLAQLRTEAKAADDAIYQPATRTFVAKPSA